MFVIAVQHTLRTSEPTLFVSTYWRDRDFGQTEFFDPQYQAAGLCATTPNVSGALQFARSEDALEALVELALFCFDPGSELGSPPYIQLDNGTDVVYFVGVYTPPTSQFVAGVRMYGAFQDNCYRYTIQEVV